MLAMIYHILHSNAVPNKGKEFIEKFSNISIEQFRVETILDYDIEKFGSTLENHHEYLLFDRIRSVFEESIAVSMYSRCSGSKFVESASSVIPIIPFMGVLIS